MKFNKILPGGILIAGILITTIGIAAAYGIFPPYITLDPITNPDAGDLLILSGTTNLPDGSELLVKIAEEPGESGVEFEKTNTGTTARVIRKAEGPNQWTAAIDTSTLRPDTYRVEVTQMTWDHTALKIILGETSAAGSFQVGGKFLGSDSSQTENTIGEPFFRLDELDTKRTGDQFLVTGSTNLPVGSDVIMEVVPSVAPDFPDTGTFSGMMANSEVTKGSGDTHRVSFAVDTVLLQPGKYRITVSNIIGDVFSVDSKPGDVSASTEFVLE